MDLHRRLLARRHTCAVGTAARLLRVGGEGHLRRRSAGHSVRQYGGESPATTTRGSRVSQSVSALTGGSRARQCHWQARAGARRAVHARRAKGRGCRFAAHPCGSQVGGDAARPGGVPEFAARHPRPNPSPQLAPLAWLLTTRWMVPPTVYSGSWLMSNASYTMPWPVGRRAGQQTGRTRGGTQRSAGVRQPMPESNSRSPRAQLMAAWQLTSKGAVAVQQDGHVAGAGVVVAVVLLGAHLQGDRGVVGWGGMWSGGDWARCWGVQHTKLGQDSSQSSATAREVQRRGAHGKRAASRHLSSFALKMPASQGLGPHPTPPPPCPCTRC